MLLELNIEQTRHNEIQILGNGEWCISLGGRDCSLQMHEQKLVEVSITQEGLRDADRAGARARAQPKKAKALEGDLGVLERMEAEAERFGAAVELDSASTFECIVEGERHYFMEVNTRIQVEHRVSELCYALRFTNPDGSGRRLRGALAGRGDGAHRPAQAAAAQARSRQARTAPRSRRGSTPPTARSAPPPAASSCRGRTRSSGEIRDDQGISIKNPDTGLFMRYRLAGAYDSNVALLLATGAGPRRELAAAGRDLPTHHDPRHRPRHQPRVPLRHPDLVPVPRPVGQADHPVRGAVPDARRASSRRRRRASTSTTRSSRSRAGRRRPPRGSDRLPRPWRPPAR